MTEQAISSGLKERPDRSWKQKLLQESKKVRWRDQVIHIFISSLAICYKVVTIENMVASEVVLVGKAFVAVNKLSWPHCL